jgi:hypothetical protein
VRRGNASGRRRHRRAGTQRGAGGVEGLEEMKSKRIDNFKLQIFNFKFVIFLGIIASGDLQSQTYLLPWLNGAEAEDRPAIKGIPSPAGYERQATSPNTFADWLRHLPIKNENDIVYLYNGTPKPNQAAQYRVLAIDVGNRDLQQCADAVIRLRAEYLFGQEEFDAIAFNFTSGHRAGFVSWRQGYRPRVQGRNVTWHQSAKSDSSYKNFRDYLETVFLYAGTYSLGREMKKVERAEEIQIGDVFIKSGFPGHAVIVVDLAVEPTTGKRVFLLAQSYMPAQEIHVLRNANDEKMNPWYEVNGDDKLYTPEWTFEWSELRRFHERE